MDTMRHSKFDEHGAVVVHFNRKRGVAFGLLFTALFGSALGRLIDGNGSVVAALSLSPLGFMGLWFLTSAWRARPELIIDPSGLTFCRAKAHLNWTEVAMVDIQEWQGNFDLKHRLIVRAVHPQRFDAMWRDVPQRPWIARPAEGRIVWPLDLLSPSSKQIADALRDCSDGAIAVGVRRVARRPFRNPDPA
jgi:hypothetical protein